MVGVSRPMSLANIICPRRARDHHDVARDNRFASDDGVEPGAMMKLRLSPHSLFVHLTSSETTKSLSGIVVALVRRDHLCALVTFQLAAAVRFALLFLSGSTVDVGGTGRRVPIHAATVSHFTTDLGAPRIDRNISAIFDFGAVGTGRPRFTLTRTVGVVSDDASSVVALVVALITLLYWT